MDRFIQSKIDMLDKRNEEFYISLNRIKKKFKNNNYKFTKKELGLLENLWNENPSACPYPSSFYCDNAIRFNSKKNNDLTYKIPYSDFYKKKQKANGVYDDVVTLVSSYFKDITKKNILDVGFGSGACLEVFMEKYPDNNFYGIENSKSAVLKAHNNINAFYGDLEKPSKNIVNLIKKTDIIISTQTFEHMESPENVLHNLISYKKKSCVIFIFVPDGRYDNSLQHIHFWSKESWLLWIKKNSANRNFKLLHMDSENPGEKQHVGIIY